jgi:putative nucleotidyltransferase with HDIG domain
MDQQAIQHFRAEVIARKNLPTIPAVLAKILELSDSVDANGKDLIAVVEKDQALTGKMLRLANSAFFGQNRRVATIWRAVLLLGFSTVRNLALGVKVWDALSSGVPRQRVEELWAHAVAVAGASKTLAGKLRSGDPDEAFTAALLHDVGRLVLAMRFKDDYWTVTKGVGEQEPVDELERSAFGVDHAEVGGWLLEAWALPPAIIELVRTHHANPTRPASMTAIAIADRLVAWTDLATGQVAPEGMAVIEANAARGVTLEVWESALAPMRDGGGMAALTGLGG